MRHNAANSLNHIAFTHERSSQVNAMIAILSAEIFSGLVGGLISTGVIVVFGEIIPQVSRTRCRLLYPAAR